jgi:hypothetical protein
MNRLTFCALVALYSFMGTGCMNSNPDSAGGVENGNPVLSGAVHDEQGVATEDAIVKLIPYDNNPQLGAAVAAATVTDAKGEYAFDRVDDGRYTIIGETPDGSLSFIDTITVENTTSKTTENVATSPGRFQGVVKLEPYRTGMVLIALLGTDIYTTTTDTTGNFTTPYVPEGNYRVLIISTLPEFSDTQITVDVVSEQTTMLDTIELGYSSAAVDTASIRKFNEANTHLAGTYLGTVTTPWVPPYTVAFTIGDDGHYSAFNVTTDEIPAFYYGTDADDPGKKIALTDINMTGGISGTLQIVFDMRTTVTDAVKNLRFDAVFDTLSFETWHSGYGPLNFKLHRIAPDAVPPRPAKTPAMPVFEYEGKADPKIRMIPLAYLDSLTITILSGPEESVIYQISEIENPDSLIIGVSDLLWRDDLPYEVYQRPITFKDASDGTRIVARVKNGNMRSHVMSYEFSIVKPGS